MRSALVVVLALACAACDRWATCEQAAEWHVDYAPQFVVPVENGDLVALTLGTGTARLARISRDGETVAEADLDLDLRYGVVSTFAVTDAGDVMMLNTDQVRSFDAAFAPRWTYVVPAYANAIVAAFAPSGETAILGPSDAGPYRVTLLEPDGEPRWIVDALESGQVRFDPDGDVLVENVFTAYRYASADGAATAFTPSPNRPATTVQRDGSGVVVELDDRRTVIRRLERDGSERWTRTLEQRIPTWNVINGPTTIVGTTGDVVLATVRFPDDTDVERTEVLRLAGDSGTILDIVQNCEAATVLAADADGYIATGPLQLARYAWP